MKLKYYLRGVGIGVIITTLIFMISISIHKDDAAAKDTEAGQDIGQTVAEANKMSTESTEPTETEITETQEAGTETPSSEIENPLSDPNGINENQQASEVPSIPEQPADPNAVNAGTPAPPEGTDGTAPAAGQTTSFTVGKGEYSDSIARRLAELTLVDNADAFNKFLIDKNYDNFILPGTYSIPLDSTYEEIAALLTTKASAANP